MGKFIDLTGQKFGRLTVLERVENKGKRTYWKCLCDCGNETIVWADNLRRGLQKSCGCLYAEKIAKGIHKTHGMRHTRNYKIWVKMKERCTNPNSINYHNYGGRGITMYPEWIDNFQAFYDYVSKLEHFGEEGYSLDRIDNNGDYCPDNLRWADVKTQARNKRSNVFVDYYGEMITIAEAAERSGINYWALLSRYYTGDRGERLFRPVRQRVSHKQ